MRRSESKADYYKRRADFERAAAECCTDVRIAGIHRELAERYHALISELRTANVP